MSQPSETRAEAPGTGPATPTNIAARAKSETQSSEYKPDEHIDYHIRLRCKLADLLGELNEEHRDITRPLELVGQSTNCVGPYGLMQTRSRVQLLARGVLNSLSTETGTYEQYAAIALHNLTRIMHRAVVNHFGPGVTKWLLLNVNSQASLENGDGMREYYNEHYGDAEKDLNQLEALWRLVNQKGDAGGRSRYMLMVHCACEQYWRVADHMLMNNEVAFRFALRHKWSETMCNRFAIWKFGGEPPTDDDPLAVLIDRNGALHEFAKDPALWTQASLSTAIHVDPPSADFEDELLKWAALADGGAEPAEEVEEGEEAEDDVEDNDESSDSD